MKDRKLATRYARALLSLLPDPREAEAADDFLTAIRRSMEESVETRNFMLDPRFSRTQRKQLLRSLADRYGMPPHVANFLATVVDHNRAGSLPSMAEVFHDERERAMGIVPAEIVSAAPLDGELLARARRTLEKVTGRRVELSHSVEPRLIAGAVTRVGSLIYDGSLRTQLASLRGKMAGE